jgi:A/G-specific adenine glycosylase
MIGSETGFRRSLLKWYDRSRRDLPWRVAPGSPKDACPHAYHVLVSEAMLQQTQVATVIPYFHRFLELFPTIGDLASADEQDVLRPGRDWAITPGAEFAPRGAGDRQRPRRRVPSTAAALRSLPGVGATRLGLSRRSHTTVARPSSMGTSPA